MMALGWYALLEARIAKLEEMAHPPVMIPLGEIEARIKALETAAQTPADGLHPETAAALARFVAALRAKLVLAQLKRGYTDEWRTDDWEVECQRQLELHVMKGDPLDVAAYCLFCFARGWSTRFGYSAPLGTVREDRGAKALVFPEPAVPPSITDPGAA